MSKLLMALTLASTLAMATLATTSVLADPPPKGTPMTIYNTVVCNEQSQLTEAVATPAGLEKYAAIKGDDGYPVCEIGNTNGLLIEAVDLGVVTTPGGPEHGWALHLLGPTLSFWAFGGEAIVKPAGLQI